MCECVAQLSLVDLFVGAKVQIQLPADRRAQSVHRFGSDMHWLGVGYRYSRNVKLAIAGGVIVLAAATAGSWPKLVLAINYPPRSFPPTLISIHLS